MEGDVGRLHPADVGTVEASRSKPENAEQLAQAAAEYKSELPGAKDRHYVILTYDTRFEHKQNGAETVVPELEEDGEWRVSGHFVR